MLEVRSILERLATVDVPDAKSMYEIVHKNADTRIKPLEKTMFSGSLDRTLTETGTEQIRQILQT